MTFESSKNLGGIGALLLFIGAFPFVNYFGILDIIGLILILVALHGFGSYYKEEGIFNNALYGVITGIVGAVVAAGVGIALVLSNINNIKDFLMKLFPSWNGSWSTISSLQGMVPNRSNITFGDVIPFIEVAIVVLVIAWVFAIVAAFYTRRSFKQLSAKANVGLFSSTGMLLLLGAVLVILFGLGLILIWIAALVLAVAFFRMHPQPAQATMTAPASPS